MSVIIIQLYRRNAIIQRNIELLHASLLWCMTVLSYYQTKGFPQSIHCLFCLVICSPIAGLPPYEVSQERDQECEGGTTIRASPSAVSTPPSRRSRNRCRKAKQISFDDYHLLWKGLATSVPTYSPNNQCKSQIQLLAGNTMYYYTSEGVSCGWMLVWNMLSKPQLHFYWSA